MTDGLHRGPDRRSVLAGALALMTPSLATAAAAEPLFRIGAIADFQYADEDDAPPRLYRGSPAKLKAAVDHFNRLDLDHVVHLGDFIDRNWTSYDAVQPIVDSLKHPWRFVLGNHDFAVDDAHKAQVAKRLGMPGRYYAFETHGWLFLALDGNDLSEYAWAKGSSEQIQSHEVHRRLYPSAPDWDGGIGPAQLDWMERQLAAADKRGLKAILYCHFPLYPENPHDLWNARDVLTLVRRHPCVKAWINGHNHEGNYGLVDGIHCVNLKAMLDTQDTAYCVIDVYADRLRINGFGRQPSSELLLR